MSGTSKLDEDTNDRIRGLVEICCCAYPLFDEVSPGRPTTGESKPDNEVDDEIACDAQVRPERLRDSYGFDWMAKPVVRETTWGDASTMWQGSYETKPCGYSLVTVIDDEGKKVPMRRPNGEYVPGDEGKDANDHQISPRSP